MKFTKQTAILVTVFNEKVYDMTLCTDKMKTAHV